MTTMPPSAFSAITSTLKSPAGRSLLGLESSRSTTRPSSSIFSWSHLEKSLTSDGKASLSFTRSSRATMLLLSCVLARSYQRFKANERICRHFLDSEVREAVKRPVAWAMAVEDDILENARRLRDDARLLFDAKRYASCGLLQVICLEEIGKAYLTP